MSTPTMSDQFAAAFRARLVTHIAEAGRPRRRRHTLLGTGAALAIVLGGAVAAAATGLLSLPGASVDTALGATRSATFTGTGTLELGPAPATATGVAISLTCLTPGSFKFDDGAAVTCTSAGDSERPTTYVIPITAIEGDGVTMTTTTDAAWSITAGYVSSDTTDWAVNKTGDSYGVINGDGQPDLIAVIATNGQQGYVYREDLADADGSTAAESFTSPEDALRWQEENAGIIHMIPVYESDGTTRIGEFRVG
ncbi:hypothetical protein [Microbacterium sulfonylureivorans]|uniref:hypothetical protein n=1 Tax=Microbacterium sulfonylureivorans TaxID=2486854 RepID=UPI000FD94653|nr:hypothetical protein [Microbacterium sulfonylureivorans]